MAAAPITVNVLQSLNVLLHLPAKLAFYRVFSVQQTGQSRDLIFGQFFGSSLRIDIRLFAKSKRQRGPNAIQVSQRNMRGFVSRKIHTKDSGHSSKLLALPLFMARI